MAKVIEKTAKTVEDALKAALEELGVSVDEVDYEVLEEASKGFLGMGILGAKPAKIRVTVKQNNKIENSTNKTEKVSLKSTDKEEETIAKLNDKPKESAVEKVNDSDVDVSKRVAIAEKFLQDISKQMKLNIKIETSELEEGQKLNICGEDLGILIGKHGQTLDALQYLVNLAANRNENQRVRFILDVENYRSRRSETLKNLSKTLAERAVRLNQEVRLEPMNRHERKVIHSSLQDNENVTTYSVGDEPNRYIIISPKKNGKSK